MRAVLLPGLDGTGALHAEFVAACAPWLTVDLLSYPVDMSAYSELGAWVRGRLPDAPFVVIAESFSGPLAVRLAADPPAGLQGVVFVTSFARPPRPAPRFAASLLKILPLKTRFACQMMQPAVMGRWASRRFTATLWAALKTVPASTLAARLSEVLGADETARLSGVAVPMMYLRARQDRLIPVPASAPFAAAGGRVVELDGPHFLLQANPLDAAHAMRGFVESLGLEAGAPRG